MSKNKTKEVIYMTSKEAAAYLKVSIQTLYRIAKTKKLKSYKVGKVARFKQEDIDKYVDGNRIC
jgi:excisionase family DNA binding protein